MGAATTPTPDPTSNAAVARRFPEEVATEGNLDLVDDLCTEDVVDHNPMGDYHGRDEVKAQMRDLLEAFGDFSATVEDVVTEGDTVAMRVTLRGRHDGTFAGLDPTGRTFEVGNMVFTRIEDGRIAERWVEPDMLGLLTQLGVTEIPEM